MQSSINIVKGDITEFEVDTIVNAANTSLLGGGGVDGAIHYKAGYELDVACRKLNGCAVGEAKITSGFQLKAKYIIHTVAPKWYDSQQLHKEELLKNCYLHSYQLALEKQLKTIAFPCLGAGIYQVPIQVSAQIAIETALAYKDSFEKIFLVCYKEEDYACYQEYFHKLSDEKQEKEKDIESF